MICLNWKATAFWTTCWPHKVRVSLVQLNSSDDPAQNLSDTKGLIEQAAADGADLILTPEVTNCVSASRSRQGAVLAREGDDQTLSELRTQALTLGKWLLIGSLALKADDPDGRFANRSFLISPGGDITARYDKIHMFDVALSDAETYRESSGYRPGNRAVTAKVPGATLGLSICYDLRFPGLFRDLAKQGAGVITVPSAFAVETGRAHWETLLRARAIETGAFIVAPAQCGTHAAATGRQRQTWGHSLVVDPWGQVLADGGTGPGVTSVDLNLELVREARQRIPALTHDREWTGPK